MYYLPFFSLELTVELQLFRAWFSLCPYKLAGFFPQGYFTAALIDASLTSCIATSFFFNGLVDLKIIPERNIFTL